MVTDRKGKGFHWTVRGQGIIVGRKKVRWKCQEKCSRINSQNFFDGYAARG